MNAFRSFIDLLLYGGASELRHYESACVDEWRRQLSPQAAEVLGRQMRRFNLIQRTPGGALVTLYDTSDPNGASWAANELFALRFPEITAARVWLRCTTNSDESDIKGDIVLHKGRLSSIEFNRPPNCLQKGFQIAKVKIFVDPMEQPKVTIQPISLAEIPGALGHTLQKLKATDLQKPPLPFQRQQALQAIDANLPADYLELLTATDGATISRWRIHGLFQIRRIVQPDANYYLLAEAVDERAIGVVQDNKQPELYLIDPEYETRAVIHLPLLDYIAQDSTENL